MAFQRRRLENHGGSGGGLRIWSYRPAGDNRAAVKAANYFNDARDVLSVRDVIIVGATDQTFMGQVSAISTAGVVTFSALQTF